MNFEELYKKKIEQKKFGDAQKGWLELEKRLDAAMPVSNKKRGFFWLFAIIATVGIVAAVTMSTINKASNTELLSSNNQASSQITIETETNNTTELATDNSEKLTNNITTINSTSNNISNQTSNINKDNNVNISTSSNNQNLQSETKYNINKSKSKNFNGNKNSLLTQQYNSFFENKNNAERNSGKSESPANIEQFKSNSDSALNFKTTNPTSAETKKKSTEEDLKSENTFVSLDNSITLAANANQSNFDFANALLPISIVVSNSNAILTVVKKEEATAAIANKVIDETRTQNSQKNSTNDNSTSIKDYANPAKKRFLSLGLYAGGMYVGNRVYNYNTTNTAYQQRRNKEEKNAWSYQYGVDVNYHIGNFIFTTGLNLNEQTSKRNYSNSFIRNIELDSTTTTIQNNNYYNVFVADSFTTLSVLSSWTSDTTEVSYYNSGTNSYTSTQVTTPAYLSDTHTVYHCKLDSVFVPNDTIFNNVRYTVIKKISDTNMKNLKGFNSVRYFEIPMMIGYQMNFNKIGITLRSGIGFGLLNKSTTYYLSNDESTIAAAKSENYQKLLYNYLLRIGLNYNVTPTFGISFEPLFRSNLNSVFNSNNGFQQKYWNLGANVGVIYKL